MKTILLLLLAPFFIHPGSPATFKFEYTGRQTPSVTKEKLSEAKLITDLAPDFWTRVSLDNRDMFKMEEAMNHFRSKHPEPVAVFPQQRHVYPVGFYDKVLDYVSVEVTADVNGKRISATGKSDKLTAEQKRVLSGAETGDDIWVTIKYKYKDLPGDEGPVKETGTGYLAVTLVPAQEAEFPGGNKQIAEYINKNVFSKLLDKEASEKMQRAVLNFTVNEEGQVVNVKLARTSSDPKLDQFLLSAINKMPKWKPALDSKGQRVKQDFTIPFMVGC